MVKTISGEVGSRRLAPEGSRWEKGVGSRKHIHEELYHKGDEEDLENDERRGGLQVVSSTGYEVGKGEGLHQQTHTQTQRAYL